MLVFKGYNQFRKVAKLSQIQKVSCCLLQRVFLVSEKVKGAGPPERGKRREAIRSAETAGG